MKVLVVSLLRIGDLVMNVPLLHALRRRYPRAQIHILTNDTNAGVVKLLPHVSRVHYFERELLQTGLGEARIPLLTSYDLLRELINELNNENFDIVINTTHTRLSGYLCALLNAEEKWGLVINDREQSSFGSNWFRHLNDFGRSKVNCFHFSDYFKFGSGALDKVTSRFTLEETEKGKVEAEPIASGKKILAVQVFTSDEKKNWNDEQWCEFLRVFDLIEPGFSIRLLTAPKDLKRIEELVARAKQQGVRDIESACISLEGAYSLLKRSQLVISTDTSIKHLAAFANAPFIELAFGSADFRRTGGYSDRSLIISNRERCFPCWHSQSCFRESRECASVSGEAVATLAARYYREDWIGLKKTAEEFADEVSIYRGRFVGCGFWWPQKVFDPSGEHNVGYLLELFAWKMLLDKVHLQPVIPYDEYVRDLLASLGMPLSPLLFERMFRRLNENTSAILRLQSDLVAQLKRSLLEHSARKSIENQLLQLESKLECQDILAPMWRELSGHGLGQVRQIQRILSDLDQIHQIRLKMLQSLRDRPREQI